MRNLFQELVQSGKTDILAVLPHKLSEFGILNFPTYLWV
jgi:hypothetical protein